MPERFIGRAGELDRVLAACRAAERGDGSLIVVIGEPGIGKTRLCQEVLVRARRGGCTAIMARCWGEGGAPAFWPWQSVLAELCGPDAAAVLAADTDPPSVDRDRFSRFAAVTDELAVACKRTPACLLIDDVHAADAGALLLTRFVARSLSRLDLALVLSRRNGEPTEGTIERELLDEIASEGTPLVLRRFDRSETSEFLAGQGLDDMDDDTLDVVTRITDGHPLFLRRIAMSASDALPETALKRDRPASTSRRLKAAIVQAFTRLSANAQQTLRISAILGMTPSIGEVAAVAETGTPAVLDAMHEAAAAGLVLTEGPHRFTFSHDLVRAALEDMLAPGERLDAHAHAAAVIGSDPQAVTSEDLVRSAHHALAAAPRSLADAQRAVTAGRLAAQSLISRFAYEQADGLLSAATALHEPSTLGPPPGSLLVEWAQTALLCGRLAEARTRFARAVAVAEQEDDPVLVAEAVLGLGGYWLTESRPPVERARIQALQRSALAALPEHHVALRCRLFARLAAEDFYNGGPLEPVYEALDAARRCGDQVALADALSLCHHALFVPEHTHARLDLADELVRVGAEAEHGVLGLMGLCWRTLDLLHLGDPRATRALEDLRHRADALACQVVLYVVDLIDVTLQKRAGRLEQAEKLAQSAFERGEMAGDADAFAYYGGQVAATRWLQGRSGELVQLVDGITSSPQLHEADFAYRASGAVFASEAGQRERAREVLDQLAGDGLAALPQSSTWLVGMMSIVELAAALDDQDVARQAYDLLHPFAGLPLVASLGVCCFGSTHRPLGIAARTFGDPELAIDHLEKAIAANQRLGNRPMVVLAQAELGALLGSSPDGERQARAPGLFTQAIERAEAMGMTERAATWRTQLDALASGLERPDQADLEDGRRSRPDTTQRLRPDQGVIRREGRSWMVAVGEHRVLVGDLVGMGYLAELLTHPGQPIPALALASGYQTVTDALQHEVLDEEARSAYTTRARELVVDLAEAEANADIGHVERLRTELDTLVDQLQTATGLSGRARVFTGPSERARTAVRKALLRAIDAIDAADSKLGDLLRTSVTTGRTCLYDPDPPVTWSSS